MVVNSFKHFKHCAKIALDDLPRDLKGISISYCVSAATLLRIIDNFMAVSRLITPSYTDLLPGFAVLDTMTQIDRVRFTGKTFVILMIFTANHFKTITKLT